LHGFELPTAIHSEKGSTSTLVEAHERLRLHPIDLKAMPHRLRYIVRSLYEGTPALIAHPILPGWIEVHIVYAPAGRAASTPCDSLHQDIVLGLEEDDRVYLPTHDREVRTERLGLTNRARKPVEDDPPVAWNLADAFVHYLHNQIVRDKIATVHKALDLRSERTPLPARRTQNITGREVLPAQRLGEKGPLCPLADPWGAKEDYD
jgi:hypothetical protein